MFNSINREEKGQTALETAIILIAFIVVATVFAFVILSAGTASTEQSESAIAAGLEGVQSSMAVRGGVTGLGTAGASVDNIVFVVSLVGEEPVNLTDSTGDNEIVINYVDVNQRIAELDWAVTWLGTNDGDALLESGEQAEINVDLALLTTPLDVNTAFTIQLTSANSGAVLQINSVTPAAIEAVMQLR